MPGARPRPPPAPRSTMVGRRTSGRSPARSVSREGPLLAGIRVTVLPGRSSLLFSELAAGVAGCTTGVGAAATGRGTQTSASFTLDVARGAWLERAAGLEE